MAETGARASERLCVRAPVALALSAALMLSGATASLAGGRGHSYPFGFPFGGLNASHHRHGGLFPKPDCPYGFGRFGQRCEGNGDASGAFALPDPPPTGVYDGPLFVLSHDYPKHARPPRHMPWRKAIHYKRINRYNAEAYVQAVKDYIADDMRTLLLDYDNWDPAKRGWYNQPWIGSIREPIHGTVVGSTFPPRMFPKSGLTETMTTHVVTYYDRVAAQSLRRVWGKTAANPVPGIERGGTQFPDGSIIIKVALTSADGTAWPPIDGAVPWQIYAPSDDPAGSDPELRDVYFFQFDIIVKDTRSSPKTRWVFATLVYDQDAPGDAWDKMVILGAQWGNDPGVVPPVGNCYDPDEGVACPTLHETWVNPAAPDYSKETLGWGGRLSGPNDGSVDVDAVVQHSNGSLEPYDGRYAMSSCMSCHGTAEYEMQSFLLPGPANCPSDTDRCTPTFATCTGTVCELVPPGPDVELVYFSPETTEFSRWFQSRPGFVPQDAGSIANDYGMNFSFKAFPLWLQQTQGVQANFVEEFNYYQGIRYPDQ